MRLSASITLALGVFLSVPSLAATVDSVRGQVSINRGQGFRQVTGSVQANIGDSVMVSAKGRARVVYPDGCKTNIDPGAVVTITAQSPCTSFAQATGEQSDRRDQFTIGPGGAIVLGGLAGEAVLILLEKEKPASP